MAEVVVCSVHVVVLQELPLTPKPYRVIRMTFWGDGTNTSSMTKGEYGSREAAAAAADIRNQKFTPKD